MDIPDDEAKSAVDTAQSLANDPAAREAAINQAEDQARAYADDPAKAIAATQAKADAEIADTRAAADAAVKARLAQAKQTLDQYQNNLPDPAKAVEDAQAAAAQARTAYEEEYAKNGPEAVAQKALEMVKQELAAVQAKSAQLEDLARQGLTGAAAMAQAVAGEILGLMSVAVAACPLAGGAPAIPSPPGVAAPAATVAKLAEMREAAVDSKAEIDAIADKLAAKYGGAVAKAPIKSEARALEKIMNDYDGDATRIKDLARNTIIVPEDKIEAVTAELEAMGAKVKVVDAAKDPMGYSGVNSSLPTSNGLPGEIQVNSPQMIYAKEKEAVARAMLGDEAYDEIKASTGAAGGLGHELYEEHRALDAKDPSTAARRSELEAASKAYYSAVKG